MKSYLKIILSILLAVMALNISYGQKYYDINDIPLSWRNFVKKDVGIKSKVAAQTYVTIDVEYDIVKSNNNGSTLEISLRITQSKEFSWVSKQFLMKASDQESLKLLNHEKLHYVVNLIGFKNMYNDLINAQLTQDYKSEITSIFNRHSRLIDKMNADYDRNTYHGTSHKNQSKWEVQIMENFNNLYANDNTIQTEYTIHKNI